MSRHRGLAWSLRVGALLGAFLALAITTPALADQCAPGGTHGDTSTGNVGGGTGNQVEVPIQVPIGVECNAGGVFGDASSSCHTASAAPPASTPGGVCTPPVETSSVGPGVMRSAPPTQSAPPPGQGALATTGAAVSTIAGVAAVLLALGFAVRYLARRRTA